MLGRMALFLPVLCNICSALEHPELEEKLFFGGVGWGGCLRLGRQLAAIFPLHLQCQGILHRIFNWFLFFPPLSVWSKEK